MQALIGPLDRNIVYSMSRMDFAARQAHRRRSGIRPRVSRRTANPLELERPSYQPFAAAHLTGSRLFR
jgi:hypothetical protein